jgi:hypothetical protein
VAGVSNLLNNKEFVKAVLTRKGIEDKYGGGSSLSAIEKISRGDKEVDPADIELFMRTEATLNRFAFA